MISNHFTTLHNLEDKQTDPKEGQECNEWTLSTKHIWKINKQHNPGIRIPTIINGRIKNSENRNPTLVMKSLHVAGSKCNNIDHKVRIIGDGHLRDTAARINQYLNTKFEVCNLIKPGAYTKQLVESMKTDFECLGKKDVIVIIGGANGIDKQ
jgi:23S rRNA pseudoU1915 N3-methylase RlmH